MPALPHPAIQTSGARPQATTETVSVSAIVATVGLFQPFNPLKIQPATDAVGGGGGDSGAVGYATAG